MTAHQQPCSDCSTVPTHGLLQTSEGWTVALQCECGAKHTLTRPFYSQNDAAVAMRLLSSRGEVK